MAVLGATLFEGRHPDGDGGSSLWSWGAQLGVPGRCQGSKVEIWAKNLGKDQDGVPQTVSALSPVVLV